MTRPRGFAPWRPQRKTQELLDQVNVVLVEYRQHWPLTIRQVFYRLVGSCGYDKTENAYERLCNHLNRARRAGMVGWDAIRDDGTMKSEPGYYTAMQPAQWLEWQMPNPADYELDPQAGQPVYTELWCEAAGMVPMLHRVVTEKGIPVFSDSGFSSVTSLYDAARRMRWRDRPTRVLHVGDYDPSGVSLFHAAADDVVAFGADAEFVRLAVTSDQIESLGLETAPPKAHDKRHHFYDDRTVQLEAVAPDDLADIITTAVENAWDHDAAAETEQRQDEAREWLAEQIAALVGDE